jgi:hypothetical protein
MIDATAGSGRGRRATVYGSCHASYWKTRREPLAKSDSSIAHGGGTEISASREVREVRQDSVRRRIGPLPRPSGASPESGAPGVSIRRAQASTAAWPRWRPASRRTSRGQTRTRGAGASPRAEQRPGGGARGDAAESGGAGGRLHVHRRATTRGASAPRSNQAKDSPNRPVAVREGTRERTCSPCSSARTLDSSGESESAARCRIHIAKGGSPGKPPDKHLPGSPWPRLLSNRAGWRWTQRRSSG